MRRQASVSTVKRNRVILDYAKTVWQNTESDVELINLIMDDWHNSRQENSKSGALKRIEPMVKETLDIARRLDAKDD